MDNSYLDKLLARELSRKEFLVLCGVAIASVSGIAGLITQLTSHAATESASGEAEAGSLSGNVSTVSDSTAAGGAAIKFGAAAVAIASTARYFVTAGGAPLVRATYQTAATSPTSASCHWVGSFASGQVQTNWTVRLDDMTTNTTGVYSKSGTGTAESTSLDTTLTAGHVYKAWVTIKQTDGQSSAIAGTRFVVPTGRVVYLEDYGAVGDGVAVDGTDYGKSVYSGPFTRALLDLHYGDTLKSKKPGVTIAGVSVAGNTVTAPGGGFTAAHVGKPIIVYGAGSYAYGASAALHTTVQSVATGGKSATIATAVTTAQADTKVLVDYPTYLLGHIDVDSNHGPGGYTIDLTGALCTSKDPNHAGFNTRLSDVTYIGVHYQHLNVTQRGNGKNNDDGSFFTTNTTTIGCRFINCYSENSQDAAFLFYGGPSDCHVVDCVDDHSYADAFHTTGGAHDIQFIRPLAIYPGDDGFANVGYLADGASGQPYNIIWESPSLHNQDWGRGMSVIGCHDILYTNMTLNGTADAAVYMGQEGGETSDTHHVQIRGGTITNPNYRRGLKPLTEGPSPSATINDRPWMLFLSGESGSQQSDIRLESLTCTDGRFVQIIRYGTGTYKDATIILTGVTMNGSVNAGTSWLDDSSWPKHIDLRAITVPSTSTTASAPVNAGTNGGS